MRSYNQSYLQSNRKICRVCRAFLSGCTSCCFFFCLFQANWEEMIVEKYCAGADVVCLADSIRAYGCSHSMKHGESKCKSFLQLCFVLVFHWRPTVDSKNWQIWAVAYKFGFLLLFSGDMNKHLSKGNVISMELFFLVWLQIWVCLQPAGLEHRQSKQSSVWNCAPYIRQKLD